MVRRRAVQLMGLGLPVPPVAALLVTNALQATSAATAIAAFGSFVAYGAVFALIARRPRCHASIMPRAFDVPTSCNSCNMDLTRARGSGSLDCLCPSPLVTDSPQVRSGRRTRKRPPERSGGRPSFATFLP
mgnify:CR=1 FL=1